MIMLPVTRNKIKLCSFIRGGDLGRLSSFPVTYRFQTTMATRLTRRGKNTLRTNICVTSRRPRSKPADAVFRLI